MNFGPELAFKIAFGVLFAAIFIGALRAAIFMKRARRRIAAGVAQEVPALKVLRPLLGAAFYGGVALWLFDALPAPLLLDLPPVLRWSAFALGLLAAAIVYKSVGALGRNNANSVALHDDHALVVEGPYAVVRHPIYASFVVLTLCGGVVAANALVLGSGVLLTVLFAALRIGPEERALKERFGASWEDYYRRTPAFVPIARLRPRTAEASR